MQLGPRQPEAQYRLQLTLAAGLPRACQLQPAQVPETWEQLLPEEGLAAALLRGVG